MEVEYVKENVRVSYTVRLRSVCLAICAAGGVLAAACVADRALPDTRPRSAPAAEFSGERAHDFVANLTAFGPRVAGSYENEVLAVGLVVEAVKRVARGAAPHVVVDLDVYTASGAFSLDFLDGMNNIYYDVTSVVARVRATGSPPSDSGALLLNCHIDTVPDSPGGSDDAAGCGVLMETLRAWAAAASPPLHPLVFLFNGAEENIMQAAHAFVSGHPWARGLRAFVNVEACGAGGRELVFRAAGAGWMLREYAAAAPRPYASSLAAEAFGAGLVPADTDYRVFREFGRLPGLDLAWAARGHVYHTPLDTAARVPPAALQRTGDNVLALTRALLAAPPEPRAAAADPLYFDVWGLWMVMLSAEWAAAIAVALLALLALQMRRDAGFVARKYGIPAASWWGLVVRCAFASAGAGACGGAAAAGAALLLRLAGRPLAFYSREWLLLPLAAAPALATAAAVQAALWRRAAEPRRAVRARAQLAAGGALWGAVLAVCAAGGLRTGFVPALWCAPLALRARARAEGPGAAWRAAARAIPAVAVTLYAAATAARALVPVAGRAGAAPADVLLPALAGLLAVAATSWLPPLLCLVPDHRKLIYFLWGVCGITLALLALSEDAAHTAETPLRLMVFHTRRSTHAAGRPPREEALMWLPVLAATTERAARALLPELRPVLAADCGARLYCGAPFYLPGLSLVGAGMSAPSADAPAARLRLNATLSELAGGRAELAVTGAGAAHAVLIVSPANGVTLESVQPDPVPGPQRSRPWNGRDVYFFTVHRARDHDRPWTLRLALRREGPGPEWAALSVAGHWQFGPEARSPELAALTRAAPPHVSVTGWTVDLHLLDV